MMNFFQNLKTNEKGFTYLSLIIGITILFIGLGFFTAIFRSSRNMAAVAKEQMAMATVAQNVAQIYLATGDENTARNEGQTQGNTVYDVTITKPEGPSDLDGIETVLITVNSIITDDPLSPRYVEPYKLVFYTPVKAE